MSWVENEGGAVASTPKKHTSRGLISCPNSRWRVECRCGQKRLHPTGYPDGETVSLGYNAQGQPVSMQDMASSFTYIRNVGYDEAGRMTAVGLGESQGAAILERSYTYAPWSQSVQGGRMSGLSTVNALSETLQQLGYQYDAGGNLTQISDSAAGETAALTYDEVERLTTMNVVDTLDESVHSEVFSYDAAGRMSGKGPDAQNLTLFSYDSAHPHAVASLGSNSYEYDANGNQVERDLTGGEYDLTYDAENRLIEVLPVGQPTPTETATPTETETPLLTFIKIG